MSIGGGVDAALDRGEEIGCDTIQIFTKNNNQWRASPLTDDAVQRYHRRQRETGIEPVVAHAAYLLNLASPKDDLWQKSVDALVVELERCDVLAIPYLVVHPGSHTGSGEASGLSRIVNGLNGTHDRLPDARAKVALEITAGQGDHLGYRFEHLAEIIRRVEVSDRLAVCFDTCHALAAGYDFRSPEGCARVFREFDDVVGPDRLTVFHLNDSRYDVGSRRDRHEHIGDGFVGLAGFRNILNDSRFEGIPMLLETPKSKDMHEDADNLTRLRALIE